MIDILYRKEKLKIMREHIVDYTVIYTMTSRIINSVQSFLRNVNFYYFSYFLF